MPFLRRYYCHLSDSIRYLNILPITFPYYSQCWLFPRRSPRRGGGPHAVGATVVLKVFIIIVDNELRNPVQRWPPGTPRTPPPQRPLFRGQLSRLRDHRHAHDLPTARQSRKVHAGCENHAFFTALPHKSRSVALHALLFVAELQKDRERGTARTLRTLSKHIDLLPG